MIRTNDRDVLFFCHSWNFTSRNIAEGILKGKKKENRHLAGPKRNKKSGDKKKWVTACEASFDQSVRQSREINCPSAMSFLFLITASKLGGSASGEALLSPVPSFAVCLLPRHLLVPSGRSWLNLHHGQ